MLFSVLLLLPSIAGFTDSTQVKDAFVYPSQGVVRQAEMSELVAQGVSKDIHERCLAAKDYSGLFNPILGSRLVFRDQRKTPQASWVERNVLIVVFA